MYVCVGFINVILCVLVVVIVYCLVVASVKHLGLLSRWGAWQMFIVLIVIKFQVIQLIGLVEPVCSDATSLQVLWTPSWKGWSMNKKN